MTPEEPVTSPTQPETPPAEPTAPEAPSPPPTQSPSPAPATDTDPGKTLAIIGLVLVLVFPLVGLILSIIAKVKSSKAGFKNGIAVAGIVLNGLSIIVGILAVILIILASSKGIQTLAADTEAVADINNQYAALESYYATNKTYPSSLSSLTYLSQESVTTPEGYTYVYAPTPAGCITDCSSYTLETQLSTGEVYRKSALK
ncbi:hypothetical protein KA047_01025 [Candidatus Saccharibacteria bacterium]|nr:hypothetical protein [Candidatus Saccharibacteria bacterium]